MTNTDYSRYVEVAKRERAIAISAMTLAVINKIEKIFRCFKTKIKNNRAYKEVNALSDAQLKDMGIGRSEIRFRTMQHCS